MTVQTTTPEIDYAGDDTSTDFAIPFYFLADTHLKVILIDEDGNPTTQVLTTDYTVTGAGEPSGGELTMLVAPATDETLRILRDPVDDQQTDYISNDPFPAETHEEALDLRTMNSQRLRRMIERCLRLEDGDPTDFDSMVLPTRSERAGKYWSFDSNGDIEFVVDIGDTVLTQAIVEGLLEGGDLLLGNGTALLPSYSFSSDPNTGMYRVGADELGFATGGTLRLTLSTSAFTSTVPFLAPAGSSALPAYSFSGDDNTGFYRPTGGEIGFALDGNAYLVGYRNIPQNVQNGNYTLVLTDSGKSIDKQSGGAGETITIPANASVAFPIGTVICGDNDGGGTLTIAITSDTLEDTAGNTGSRTVADNGHWVIRKIATTKWRITGTGVS